MSEETTHLMQAIYHLEDAREVLRETAPSHEMTGEQKKQYTKALEDAIASVHSLMNKLK